MSSFAAGCAVCGFDLEDWRRRQAASRVARVRGLMALPVPWADRRRDVLLLLLLFFLLAFSPLIGVLIAGLVAFAKHREGDIATRNLALVFVALDFVALWLGVALGWGLLGLLGVF